MPHPRGMVVIPASLRRKCSIKARSPVVGDRHYVEQARNTPGIDRQALHASRLGFIHPGTEKYVEFTADLPGDFARLLESSRRGKRGPG